MEGSRSPVTITACGTESPEQAAMRNVMTLAFLGDAVQTLYVRLALMQGNNCRAKDLHSGTADAVNAQCQARAFERLLPQFTDSERGVAMRARNAKGGQPAKNASVVDYRKATGLEAVLGYLYLSGQTQRLNQLLEQTLTEK